MFNIMFQHISHKVPIIFGAIMLLFLGFVKGEYLLPSNSYNQGFNYFQQQGKTHAFQCTKECLLLLGLKKEYDILEISNIAGEGMLLLGAVGQGNQVIPIQQQNINGSDTYQLSLSNKQIGSIPAEAQLVLVFIGAISGSTVSISMHSMTVGESLLMGWRQFWTNEPLMPYSINLRYGISIGSTSIIMIGYVLFAICASIILAYYGTTKKAYQMIWYSGIIFVIALGSRNMVNRIDWTQQGLRNYTFASSYKQSFFDLGDYIAFADKMRGVLDLDNAFGKKQCSMMLYGQPRPFVAHLDTVYIKPCESTTDIKKADYIIYYHQPISGDDMSKQVLLDLNGSKVLKNSK